MECVWAIATLFVYFIICILVYLKLSFLFRSRKATSNVHMSDPDLNKALFSGLSASVISPLTCRKRSVATFTFHSTLASRAAFEETVTQAAVEMAVKVLEESPW